MGVAQLHVESNQFELPVVKASRGPDAACSHGARGRRSAHAGRRA